MKKKLLLLVVLFASIFASSCYDPYYYDYVEACFYSKEDTYLVGEEVQFYNCSDQADSYFWNFGDGETSSLINPKHTYLEDGEYEVKLSAYGRDGGKDINYTVLTIIGESTKLNILVQYFGTTDEVADCPVDLYANETDWANFQNPVMNGTTDDDGILEFSDLQPQIYYVDAFKSVSDTGYYSNEDAGVETNVLVENTINYYDVFVEYFITSSGKKFLKVKEIVKSSQLKRDEYFALKK